MTTRKTELTYGLAREIALAASANMFSQYGGNAKYAAQRNLSGKTHYVDENTLKFFHARINSCRAECQDLVLIIVESVAADHNNTKRGHRFVAFDLFGTVINDRDHTDAMQHSSDKAHKAAHEWLESFDVLAHYKAALTERADRLKRNADDMAKIAKAIRV